MFHSEQFISPLTLFQVQKQSIGSCGAAAPLNSIDIRLVTHGRRVAWLYPGRGWPRLPRGFALEYLILLFFLYPSENFCHFCCSHCEKPNPGSPSLETEVWLLFEASSISVLCCSLWKSPGERWDLDLQVLMKGVEWPGVEQKPPWPSWPKSLSALLGSALRTTKRDWMW